MKLRNRNYKPFSLLLIVLILLGMIGVYYLSYTYIFPTLDKRLSTSSISFSSNTPIKRIENTNTNAQVDSKRVVKVKNVYQDLPGDITSEVVYKDVRLISTSSRPFSEKEIVLVQRAIDLMPRKLFDYRPLAIVSITFNQEDLLLANRPEGVAFASGPYIFLGDSTFRKQDSYDTGTFRGLFRVLAHEFTHVAQFFAMQSYSNDFINTYLEKSPIVQEWIINQGWSQENKRWVLGGNQLTTEYGKSHPTEDMADALGSLVIGDEFSISEQRVKWLEEWLEQPKSSLFVGTVPTFNTIKQRKTDSDSAALLKKYKDSNAQLSDVMTFQSTTTISVSDLAKLYNTEFGKRGWTGSINDKGFGEFKYGNLFKVHIEIDKNPLKVITIVMHTY